MNYIRIIVASILSASVMAPLSANAAPKGDQLGVLECTVDGGIGLLVGSSKKVNCTFAQSNGAVDAYSGKISKLGLDLGVTGKSYIKWVVFTPAGTELADHPLSGRYVGVSTGATLGIGLGANALVGGNDKQIGLQPLSVEGQTGLNVALAVSTLTLNAEK
uniref:DUF992 domain-containing protein n=1 Tax=Pararhizobium sp. IMCC3301 TaxID=3067904 RepID=UPI0027419548|nr:DUF992 domain-containing protein [Pararhizobium sp. IMCC3301]